MCAASCSCSLGLFFWGDLIVSNGTKYKCILYAQVLFFSIPSQLKLFIPSLHIAAKNGVYITLVKDVRNAFEGSPLVKIDCKGMHASDYKKLGAKLKVCNIFCYSNSSGLEPAPLCFAAKNFYHRTRGWSL